MRPWDWVVTTFLTLAGLVQFSFACLGAYQHDLTSVLIGTPFTWIWIYNLDRALRWPAERGAYERLLSDIDKATSASWGEATNYNAEDVRRALNEGWS